jgi:chromatin segregation and condensation protein Rec8/ScpA/Scc1 (kleisin family)
MSTSTDPTTLPAPVADAVPGMPEVVDQVALARLYGEPLFAMPSDLYIPPEALEVFLEAFEGPLDLLLYLIRKQNFNILDIPMAAVTRQYLTYVDEIRGHNLELAAEYLLMAAMLIEIKSRMLLPPKKVAEGQEPEDPRAELVRRLLEYEQMKLAAARLNEVPQLGRDVLRAQVTIEQSLQPRFPDVNVVDLQEAWRDILKRAKLVQHHRITREELSVREHMSIVLRTLQGRKFVEFEDLFDVTPRRAGADRDLYCDAGTGQGNADRGDPGRSLRPHLRAPGVLACMTTLDFDVLIVGSGLAGLSAAMHLAPTHRVAVLTKRAMSDGSSGWAQGGIAAVLAEGDSFDAHVDDTLVAGAGLSDPAATRFVVEHAPESINWLRELGVPFSEEDGHLHLTREGGHSARRIVHVTDATGAAVQKTLIEHVRRTPNITLFEHHTLVDLITGKKRGLPLNRCLGLYALDEQTDQVLTFRAPHTILATGGAGKVYLYTTNPDTATGDGIAAAWRAGCRVTNMEFIQFHPTCLYHPHAKSFLISEAVRGEGGQLKLPDGTRFMPSMTYAPNWRHATSWPAQSTSK